MDSWGGESEKNRRYTVSDTGQRLRADCRMGIEKREMSV